jgi:hypothetical protein
VGDKVSMGDTMGGTVRDKVGDEAGNEMGDKVEVKVWTNGDKRDRSGKRWRNNREAMRRQ